MRMRVLGAFALSCKTRALLVSMMIASASSKTCPGGHFFSIDSSECYQCPNNTWSDGGNSENHSRFCRSNAGYYNLQSKTMAHYSLQPSTFLKDVSGNLNELITLDSLPTSTVFGPWTNFGGAQFKNTSQPSQGQYFKLPSLTLVSSNFSVCTW